MKATMLVTFDETKGRRSCRDHHDPRGEASSTQGCYDPGAMVPDRVRQPGWPAQNLPAGKRDPDSEVKCNRLITSRSVMTETLFT